MDYITAWKNTLHIYIPYIYTIEYYTTIKKNEIMPFTESQMDLEIGILSERKGEGEKS